jgi:TM2 domain-containing membrane protein YozV
MKTFYFIEMKGRTCGPYNIKQLRNYFENGVIDEQTPLVMEGQGGEWTTCQAIIDQLSPTERSEKSKVVYVILALFLGVFGVHNFYSGHTASGIVKLLLTLLLGWTVIVIIFVFLMCIIDICTVTRDADGCLFS